MSHPGCECKYKVVNGKVTLSQKCPAGCACPPYAPVAPLPEDQSITFPMIGNFASDPTTWYVLHPRDDELNVPAYFALYYIDGEGNYTRDIENLDMYKHDPMKPRTFASHAANQLGDVQVELCALSASLEGEEGDETDATATLVCLRCNH